MLKFISNIFGGNNGSKEPQEIDRKALNDDQATIVAFGDRILKIFCGKNNIGSDLIDVKKRIHSLATKEKLKIYKDGKLHETRYESTSKDLKNRYLGTPDYKYINLLFSPIDNLLRSNYSNLNLEQANNTLQLLKNACLATSKASEPGLEIFDDNVKSFFKLVYQKLPNKIQELNQKAQQVRDEKAEMIAQQLPAVERAKKTSSYKNFNENKINNTLSELESKFIRIKKENGEDEKVFFATPDEVAGFLLRLKEKNIKISFDPHSPIRFAIKRAFNCWCDKYGFNNLFKDYGIKYTDVFNS